MGYTTDFSGRVTIDPPLNAEEVKYLTTFAGTRRMDRKNGPYYAVDDGDYGQSRSPDIVDFNTPPDGQPGLWCHWVPWEDGSALEWDGSEKFYESELWMKYLVDHFLKPAALAKDALPFLQANHTVNGEIDAQGEDTNDRWRLVVENNVVYREEGEISFNGRVAV